MELKEGYKKTEVGVIPEDWEIFPLGELFSFSGGHTASRDQLSGDGFCYLHYGDIHKSNKTYINVKNEYQEIPKLNVPIKMVSQKSLLNDGDVVFVDASEDDEGASKHIVVQNQDEITYISGLHTIVSKSKNYYVYNGYKQHCFQTADVKKQFKFYAVGTKVSGISKANIAKIQIPLPPTKVEQTAIATALNDADALIQSLGKLIAKKRNIKQGAMQELLKPKEGWVVKKLGEIISFVVDNRGKTPPLAKSGHPLIEVNAIYNQGKSPNYSVVGKFVDQVTYDSWFRDGHPQIGDVLVVTVGTAGSTSFVTEGIGCIAQNIIALRFHKTFSSEYFYYLTLTNLFQDQVRAVLMGAVQPSLKVPHLKEFLLPFPSLPEQTHIATILSDMDAEIAELEAKLGKYKQIKQGMMQNLLTGRIRLT